MHVPILWLVCLKCMFREEVFGQHHSNSRSKKCVYLLGMEWAAELSLQASFVILKRPGGIRQVVQVFVHLLIYHFGELFLVTSNVTVKGGLTNILLLSFNWQQFHKYVCSNLDLLSRQTKFYRGFCGQPSKKETEHLH